jgi:hypothetical protein
MPLVVSPGPLAIVSAAASALVTPRLFTGGGRVAFCGGPANVHARTSIVFDSDVMVKHQVRAVLLRLKSVLESRGAKVKIILLPAQLQGGRPA